MSRISIVPWHEVDVTEPQFHNCYKVIALDKFTSPFEWVPNIGSRDVGAPALHRGPFQLRSNQIYYFTKPSLRYDLKLAPRLHCSDSNRSLGRIKTIISPNLLRFLAGPLLGDCVTGVNTCSSRSALTFTELSTCWRILGDLWQDVAIVRDITEVRRSSVRRF